MVFDREALIFNTEYLRSQIINARISSSFIRAIGCELRFVGTTVGTY